MKNFLILLCGILILAGCASSSDDKPRPGKRGQGYYKVGSPYEVSGETYTPKENSSYDETGIASWYGPGFHGGHTANGETYDTNDLTAAHRTLPLPSLVRVTNVDNGKSVVVRVNDRGPFASGRIIDVSHKAADLLGFIGAGTAKVHVQLMDKESKVLQAAAKKGIIIAGLDDLQHMQSENEPETIVAPATATMEEGDLDIPPTPTVEIATEELPVPVVVSPVAKPGNEQRALKVAGLDKNLVGSYDKTGRFQPAPSIQQMPAHPNSKIYIQAGAFGNQANAERLKNQLASLGPVAVSTVEKAGKTLYRVRVGPVSSVNDADNLLNRVLKTGARDARTVVDY